MKANGFHPVDDTLYCAYCGEPILSGPFYAPPQTGLKQGYCSRRCCLYAQAEDLNRRVCASQLIH